MTPRQRAVIADVVGEINPIKSDLIRQFGKLESVEARAAASSLAKIIGQLEGWQARFTR